MLRALVCTVLLLGALAPLAESQPQPTHIDQRIKTLTYQADQVFSIKAHEFVSTLIQLGADESLRADVPLVGGDLDAWSIHFVGERALAVKPIQRSPKTNLTIMTTRRIYHFDLDVARAMRSDDTATYAIRFVYPDVQAREDAAATKKRRQDAAWRLDQRTVDPAMINFNYRVRGAKKLRPRQIFDDGQFTYFLFNERRPVPAVFAVDEGQESLVNFARRGAYFLVQRLAARFVLRSGKAKAVVIREALSGDE